MSTIIAHNIFAKKQYTFCVDKCNFLIGNFDVFSIGNQGLDVLNYSEFIFNINNDKIFKKEDLAIKIKEQDFDLFFLGFSQIVDTYMDDTRRKIACSFLFGLLSNYCLERKIQPFIFYRTGFSLDGSLSPLDKTLHRRYETLTDFSLRKYYKYSESANKPHQSFEIEKNRLDIVSSIFYDVIKHIYPDSNIKPNTYANCLMNYRKYIKSVNTLNRDLFFALGMKHTTVGSQIMPKKLRKNEKIDYLNLTHQEWHDPVTYKQENTSFIDIFEKCLSSYDEYINIVTDSYKGKKVDTKLKKYLQNLNFYGQEFGKKRMYQNSLFK